MHDDWDIALEMVHLMENSVKGKTSLHSKKNRGHVYYTAFQSLFRHARVISSVALQMIRILCMPNQKEIPFMVVIFGNFV